MGVASNVKSATYNFARTWLIPVDGLVERPHLDTSAVKKSCVLIIFALLATAWAIGIITFFQARKTDWEHMKECEEPRPGQQCRERTKYPLIMSSEVNSYLNIEISLKRHLSASELEQAILGAECEIGQPFHRRVESYTWADVGSKTIGTRLHEVCNNYKWGLQILPDQSLEQDMRAFMVLMNNAAAAHRDNWRLAEVRATRSSTGTNRTMDVKFMVAELNWNRVQDLEFSFESRDCFKARKPLTLYNIFSIKEGTNCSKTGNKTLTRHQQQLEIKSLYNCARRSTHKFHSAFNFFELAMQRLEIIPYRHPFLNERLVRRLCSHERFRAKVILNEHEASVSNQVPERSFEEVAKHLAEGIISRCPYQWECKVTEDYPNMFVWFSLFYPFFVMFSRFSLSMSPTIYGKLAKETTTKVEPYDPNVKVVVHTICVD